METAATRGKGSVKSNPGGPFPELFDLSIDISEANNVAADHPDLVAEMTAAIRNHKTRLANERRPIGQEETTSSEVK